MIRIKNIYFLSLALLLMTGVSCKQNSTKTDESGEHHSQMEEVMAIHDEVMPKMGKLSKLVAQLKPMADSTTVEGQPYHKAMTDLQDSYQSMMDWMKNFGGRFDHKEILEGKELTSQKQEWLNEEEQKVKLLRDEINGSIKRAEELLASQD